MTFVAEEIASQPRTWAQAADLAGHHADALPAPGERVAVVGCGTSWFMAQSYAALREAAGQGETDAFAASQMPAGRRYDRVIAITRSGTTSEVCELLEHLDTTTVAIVGEPGTPATRLATHGIEMPFADEKSVVQTRYATSALALLRAHLGEDLTAAIKDAETAVDAEPPLNLDTLEQVTFLGDGWTVGLAHEAGLKMREAATFWTESYPAMEYRHGPISITGPDRAAWMFGPAPEGLEAQVTATGGRFITGDLDPMAELVRAQRLAVAMAEHRGLDPDSPRHLTRSVILP
ncbi:fructoselysine-6-P-deglycase FrlB-like protein [Stackebrandtia albiflava]|uniref:Fructoselysine-6-P-deglycase FrlB-like protein n=1 Tax=Stackebrandtia albiflava TaxID=406432 RepID=A0A562UYI6_9ACTN|nr:SIS domain-containing protein [Stackebrandtia albiflava]TWJ10700.1 fructoselysine-6-P-deglycase FrlB-like protein [Stackebrandtia albiflava]